MSLPPSLLPTCLPSLILFYLFSEKPSKILTIKILSSLDSMAFIIWTIPFCLFSRTWFLACLQFSPRMLFSFLPIGISCRLLRPSSRSMGSLTPSWTASASGDSSSFRALCNSADINYTTVWEARSPFIWAYLISWVPFPPTLWTKSPISAPGDTYMNFLYGGSVKAFVIFLLRLGSLFTTHRFFIVSIF